MNKRVRNPYPIHNPTTSNIILQEHADNLKVFLDKPFWIWDKEEHDIQFKETKGQCCHVDT